MILFNVWVVCFGDNPKKSLPAGPIIESLKGIPPLTKTPGSVPANNWNMAGYGFVQQYSSSESLCWSWFHHEKKCHSLGEQWTIFLGQTRQVVLPKNISAKMIFWIVRSQPILDKSI